MRRDVEIMTDANGNRLVRYNVFRATLLMRHASSGKVYLYDVTEIKKEPDILFGSEDLTQ